MQTNLTFIFYQQIPNNSLDIYIIQIYKPERIEERYNRKKIQNWTTDLGWDGYLQLGQDAKNSQKKNQRPKNHCGLYLMPYHYAKLCTLEFARNENNLGRNDMLC